MSIPARQATAALKSLSLAERRQLITLANKEHLHPDARVRQAAYTWSHSADWERVWYRIPGWVQPLAAFNLLLIMLGMLLVSGVDVSFAVLALPGLVIFMGLWSWNNQAAADMLRRLYPAPHAAV